MPRIDPTVLGDLAELEASHRRKIRAVEAAEATGNLVRAHAARTDLMLFEVLFCEQEKVEATR